MSTAERQRLHRKRLRLMSGTHVEREDLEMIIGGFVRDLRTDAAGQALRVADDLEKLGQWLRGDLADGSSRERADLVRWLRRVRDGGCKVP